MPAFSRSITYVLDVSGFVAEITRFGKEASTGRVGKGLGLGRGFVGVSTPVASSWIVNTSSLTSEDGSWSAGGSGLATATGVSSSSSEYSVTKLMGGADTFCVTTFAGADGGGRWTGGSGFGGGGGWSSSDDSSLELSNLIVKRARSSLPR